MVLLSPIARRDGRNNGSFGMKYEATLLVPRIALFETVPHAWYYTLHKGVGIISLSENGSA